MNDNGSFDKLPNPDVNNIWHAESEYDALQWNELDGAKFQIMRQAAMMGILGVAWHCIAYHEPIININDDTLSVYAMGDDCDLYTRVDFHFTESELMNGRMESLSPGDIFHWIMTALMDPDTSKRINHPAIIEGKRIRVEIG